MTKVRQIGLFCKSLEQMEEFADRVSEYNKEKGFVVVELEGQESGPDQLYDGDHWKVTLEFKSRSYANDFWTDPKYQTNILT